MCCHPQFGVPLDSLGAIEDRIELLEWLQSVHAVMAAIPTPKAPASSAGTIRALHVVRVCLWAEAPADVSDQTVSVALTCVHCACLLLLLLCVHGGCG